MDIEQKKISELPEATTFNGLYTIGTDADNKSVKVPLGAVVCPPYINPSNGHWMVWSMSSKAYVDSGVASKGEKGDPFTYADFTAAQLAALKGVGVSSSEVGYCTTIGQDVDVSQLVWDDEIPEVQQGHWLWTRLHITFTDNSEVSFITKVRNTADGKSVYETAVDGGYTGTYEEYAAMLANLGDKHVVLTESAYEAITTPDPDKIYMTYEDE